ncbi:ABC transporter permease [Arthrobacter ginkgonis]|uniref:ABC transporter permease n=1 Tax=Arthrobacter ginkgonis TaxID=1630594 RepID=A0ABP7BVR9_9MICC
MSTTAPEQVPAAAAAPTPAGARPRSIRTTGWTSYAGYGVVVLVLALFAVVSPVFTDPANIASIINQATVTAIAGMGLAVVIIVGGDDVVEGGIDLSVGATAAVAGSVTAVLTTAGVPPVLAILAALGTTLLIGTVNGVAVGLGLRPLLATLATMGIATSLDLVISQNMKIALDGQTFTWLRDASGLGVSGAVVVLLVVAAALIWVFHRTRLGVNAYAVGQNPTAARVAGLNPGRYRFASYLISSGLAGVAGILLASRLSAAVPGIGTQILLDIILVAYMSTVFSRRLVITIGGTLLAALFVTALSNGMTLAGIASQWVGAVKGALILAVLTVVVLRSKAGNR